MTLFNNAWKFFEKIANDKLEDNKFDNWLIKNKDKTFAVLKSHDSAGKYFVKKLKSMNIKIILSNAKGYLNGLSSQDFKIIKQADIIVQCSVHTSMDYDEYNGVKAININTIFDL